jgi:glycosyltransferase involved in cell wall biosynthesis
MKDLRLTIAIPTYNRLRYLLKYLPDIIDQMTEECELLIVDNNSNDNVVDNCLEVLSSYENIQFRVIKK